MILPLRYLDDTMGVRPSPNQESFNNVVYSAWYHIAKLRSNTHTPQDSKALLKHLYLNTNDYGLYAPKHSHDNITYMLILFEVFGIPKLRKMNFLRAIKDIGLFRVWDVITYGSLFGPGVLRYFFRLFLFIPALQMVHAALKKDKIRPKLIEKDRSISRFPWWFLPKKFIRITDESNSVVTFKEWKDYKGTKRITRHMQNDGKHLSVFRLYAFSHKFWIFKITSKLVRRILISRYGDDYTYEIINSYFEDRGHPVISLWKNNGDILR